VAFATRRDSIYPTPFQLLSVGTASAKARYVMPSNLRSQATSANTGLKNRAAKALPITFGGVDDHLQLITTFNLALREMTEKRL